MENRSHALIAGLFTLLLGIAAVAAVWWFGGKYELRRDYLVVTRQNVTGLSPQAQVRYRGIAVGKVLSIELDPQDVRNILIRISIKAEVPVTRGTTAKIGFQGVTGIAHILLEESGSDPSPLLASGDEPPRIAMRQSLIEELSEVGGQTLREMREFLLRANQVLNPESRQHIARTLANLEATSAAAERTLGRLQQLMSPENLRLVNAVLQGGEKTLAQSEPFFAEARELVADLRQVGRKLDVALDGSPLAGDAPLVLRLNELSGELSASSRRLGRILGTLEESPESLLFGRQAPAPGPGEAGFTAPERARKMP